MNLSSLSISDISLVKNAVRNMKLFCSTVLSGRRPSNLRLQKKYKASVKITDRGFFEGWSEN